MRKYGEVIIRLCLETLLIQNLKPKFIVFKTKQQMQEFGIVFANERNGAGLQVGSQVMRWACKKKDVVFILKEISNKLYYSMDLVKSNKLKFNEMASMRKSFQPQKKKVLQSHKSSSSIYDISMIENQRDKISSETVDEEKISLEIRSVNKECKIIYCYFVKEKDSLEPQEPKQTTNVPDFPQSHLLKKQKSLFEYQAVFDSRITRPSTQFSKVMNILKDIQNQRKHSRTELEKKKPSFFQRILGSLCPSFSKKTPPSPSLIKAKINTETNQVQSSQGLFSRFKSERGHYL